MPSGRYLEREAEENRRVSILLDNALDLSDGDNAEKRLEERISEAVHPGVYAVMLSNLIDYVMPDPEPHLSWQTWTLEKLSAEHPRTAEDRVGDVVPREALDPEADVSPEQVEELINAFLQGLDHARNPFLRSPETMLAGDDEFEAYNLVPYRFSVAEDRELRQV